MTFYELTSSWRLFWFNVEILELLLAVLLLMEEVTDDDEEDAKELLCIDDDVMIVEEVKEELFDDIDVVSQWGCWAITIFSCN